MLHLGPLRTSTFSPSSHAELELPPAQLWLTLNNSKFSVASIHIRCQDDSFGLGQLAQKTKWPGPSLGHAELGDVGLCTAWRPLRPLALSATLALDCGPDAN